MRRALVLVLALSACTSEPSEPMPDEAGDGDGDMGEAGDGDSDEPLADLPEPMSDLPAEGLNGCCICSAPAMCETNVPGSEGEAQCQAYGDLLESASEWHTDCYYDASETLRCPGSCAEP